MRILLAIVVLVGLMAIAAACGDSATTTEAPAATAAPAAETPAAAASVEHELVGFWKSTGIPIVVNFEDDGTFEFLTPSGAIPMDSGTYEIGEGTVTFVSDGHGQSCGGDETGTYTFELTDDGVSFAVQDDACAARKILKEAFRDEAPTGQSP